MFSIKYTSTRFCVLNEPFLSNKIDTNKLMIITGSDTIKCISTIKNNKKNNIVSKL